MEKTESLSKQREKKLEDDFSSREDKLNKDLKVREQLGSEREAKVNQELKDRKNMFHTKLLREDFHYL